MTWFFVALAAAVYGLIMKYVLNNVFVSKHNNVNASPAKSAEKETRDLIPAYDR